MTTNQHPNLIFGAEDVARIKKNIETYDWARTLFEEVKGAVDGGADFGTQPTAWSGYTLRQLGTIGDTAVIGDSWIWWNPFFGTYAAHQTMEGEPRAVFQVGFTDGHVTRSNNGHEVHRLVKNGTEYAQFWYRDEAWRLFE